MIFVLVTYAVVFQCYANILIFGSKISANFATSSSSKPDMSISETDLRKLVAQLPPPLSEAKHKGQAGRIGIIGGSLEYTGAPYFAGMTALRCGADLAYVFCMKDAAAPIKSYSPELIVLPYLDSPQGYTLTTSRLHNIHSLVIGPGLGENKEVHSLVVALIGYIKNNGLSSKISLVFDADGIGLLADNEDLLSNYAGHVYVTPNANEIKKLVLAFLGSRDINIPDSLTQLERCISPNAVVILKGQNDTIAASGSTYTCSVRGSLRRIGGQGDLLSGSLGVFSYWATLLGQNGKQVNSAPAAVLAAYSACSITRLCSHFAYQEKSRSMITSDMIAQVGKAYKTCFES